MAARVIAIQPLSSTEAQVSDLTSLLFNSRGEIGNEQEVEEGLTQAMQSGMFGDKVSPGHLRRLGWHDNRQEQKLVKVYTLAPLLFGKVFQPDLWIRYLYEVGLLPSPSPTSVDSLEDKYLCVVEMLEITHSLIFKEVKLDQETRIGQLNSLFNEIDTTVFSSLKSKPRPLTEILDRAKKYDFLHVMKDEVKKSLGKSYDRVTLTDREIAVGMLFSCRQYVEHAYKVTDSKVKLVEQFVKNTQADNQKVIETKEQGNERFKARSYIQASQLYTQAIYISPFNHILYGNRAQSYLNSGSYRAALSDGKRAIVLAPDWHKGYYRYAQAFWELGEKSQAFDVIEKGLSRCPADKNLLEQRAKFREEVSRAPKPCPTETSRERPTEDMEDDVPDLISSTDSDSSCHCSDADSSGPRGDSRHNRYDSDSDDERIPPKLYRSKDEEVRARRKYLEEERRKMQEQAARKEEEKRLREESQRRKKEQEKQERQRKRDEQEKKNEAKKVFQLRAQREAELTKNLEQGSKALLDQKPQSALVSFQKGLDIVLEFTVKYFPQFREMDLVVLKYSIGTSSVAVGTTKEIQSGVKVFEEIATRHRRIRFPLVFLGLGHAFYKLARFKLALEHLFKGQSVLAVSDDKLPHNLKWPGSTVVIDDTRPGHLKVAIESLIVQCRNPPPPVAVCRHDSCQGHYKVKIYTSDPDFKGYVRVVCYDKCIIEYHVECWRRYKRDRLSQSDKDYLNVPCMTPDCPSKVWTIETFDHRGALLREWITPEHDRTPPVVKPTKQVKMKPSSLKTINKRLEKKRLRREFKQEDREKRTAALQAQKNVKNTAPRKHSGDAKSTGVVLGVKVNERSDSGTGNGEGDNAVKSYATVLSRKEGEDVDRLEYSKTGKWKSKKKQQRPAKVTMSLDEFVGPREDGEDALDGREDVQQHTSARHSHMNELDTFDAIFADTVSLTSSDSQTDGGKSADIKDTLFSFFFGILQEHGPLNVDDIIIQRELGDFPAEAHELISKAGGIDKFLLQSLQFAVIDDFVCLLQDTVKARHLSEVNKNPLKASRGDFVSGRKLDQLDSFSCEHLDTDHQSASGKQDLVSDDLIRKSVMETDSGNQGDLTIDDDDDYDYDKKFEDVRVESGTGKTNTVDLDNNVGSLNDSLDNFDVNPINKFDKVEMRQGDVNWASGIAASDSPAGTHDWHNAALQWGNIAQDTHPPNVQPGDAASVVVSTQPVESGLSTPNSCFDILDPQTFEDGGVKYGPIGSRTTTPAHSSSRSSSITATPNHTPHVDALPHFPSVHNADTFSDKSFTIGQPIAASLVTQQETEADQFNEETFGIPRELSETSQDYNPLNGIDQSPLTTGDYNPLTGTDQSLPYTFLPNRSVWSTGDSPLSPAASLLRSSMEHGSLANQQAENEVDRHDDMFVEEMSQSVYNSMTEPFRSNDPALMNNIKADIRQDLQRAKMSASSGGGVAVETKPETCSVACQWERGTSEVGCNTEPYEPYKEAYLKAAEDVDNMNSRLHDLMNKQTHLQNSSSAEISGLRSLVDALEHETKGLRQERDVAVEERSKESKKWTNEKKAMGDELKNLQKDLKNAKYREEHLTNLLMEQKQREQEITERNIIDRDSLDCERERFEREKNTLQEKYSTELSRAENSEVKLLELKVEVGSQMLARSLKDAEIYAAQLSSRIQSFREKKQQVPPHFQVSLEQWRVTALKIREIKDKAMSEFEEQIRLVRQGKPLDTLPCLPIPRPPPPPETSVGPNNKVTRPVSSGGFGPPGLGQMPPPGLLPPGVRATCRPANQHSVKSSTAVQQQSSRLVVNRAVNDGHSRPQPHKSKNAYEKVLDALSCRFPQYSKTDIGVLVQNLRTARNGSLSGLSLEQIVRQVAEMILKDQQKKSSQTSQICHITPPGNAMLNSHPLQPPTAVIRGPGPSPTVECDEIFEEEEDPCIICHDELTDETSLRLECGHRYHSDCIKKWFNEQSTCPTCRVHALLPEDFPSLV